MLSNKEKIALFIDADNAPAAKLGIVLSGLADLGVVSIRKAYGNWASPHLKPWADILHEHAIQPVQQFDLTRGKNATDIALVIDVMDVLHTKEVDIICLMSSDVDFAPLATRVRSDGKMVVGLGERKAPDAFVNSCSTFWYFDKPVPRQRIDVESRPDLKSNTKLLNTLRQAVAVSQDSKGWAKFGCVEQYINKDRSFVLKDYGFSKLGSLYAAIDLFEIKYKDGSVTSIKDKRKASKLVK